MRQDHRKIDRWMGRHDDDDPEWMVRHSIVLLRVSVGVVFLWFGALKFFGGLSPAEDLATRTISILTFGLIPSHVSIVMLATWESLIGIGLISGVMMRATLLLLFMQMAGTLTPLVFFPHETFTRAPFAPTLEGQYIIKNIVLISAGVLLYARLRARDRVRRVVPLRVVAESDITSRLAA